MPTIVPTPTPISYAAIVMGAAESFNTGDLELAMSYWADDAMFYMFGMPPTGSEVLQGAGQIRGMYEENIASHSRWEIEINSIVGYLVEAKFKNWHNSRGKSVWRRYEGNRKLPDRGWQDQYPCMDPDRRFSLQTQDEPLPRSCRPRGRRRARKSQPRQYLR